MRRKTILVVEDGTEYVETFRRLAMPEAQVDFLPACDVQAARRILSERRVDGVFLDVVFDRIPAGNLCGNLEPLITRFAGDDARAFDYLARNQGFFLAHALAPLIPPGVPVLLAYDFSSEPARLAALKTRLPRLEGVEDGVPISKVLERLLR
ncbi:MAG TPA: hypothetical protein VGL03_13470 [Thermoanaerobaculia bacterium]